MNEKKIIFENIDWEKGVGSGTKEHNGAEYKLRLVNFDDNFKEKEWCIKGHIGYVLEGEMIINFNGQRIHYKKGDGIYIKPGIENKHKATIEKHKSVKLFLVEKTDGF